jgi:hypothetical protein
VILQEGTEAWLVDEGLAAPVGGRVGEGGEPGDIFAVVLLFVGELGHVDLAVRHRRGEESDCGELEVVAHLLS